MYFAQEKTEKEKKNGDSVFSAVGSINTGLLNAPTPDGIVD